MNTDNQTTGYYTAIDERLYGPVQDDFKFDQLKCGNCNSELGDCECGNWEPVYLPPVKEGINMHGLKTPKGCDLDFYCNYPKCHCECVKSLPSYAVSPDLLLKERMVEFKDFGFITEEETGNKIAHPYPFQLGDYKPASLDNAGKVEGETLAKYIEWIKRNANKINEHSWKVYKEQILAHVEDCEAAIADHPRSFTSKDMEAFAELCIREGWTIYTVCVRDQISELLNKFINRDDK